MAKSYQRKETTRSTSVVGTKQKIDRRTFLKVAGVSAAAVSLGGKLPISFAQGTRNLRVGDYGEPAGLNPILRMGIQGNHVANNIHSRLVRMNYTTNNLEPALATHWGTEDPLTWVIKLREGVKWQKGYGEFTADDVVYTWLYQIQNKTFQVGTALFPVTSVKARDKYTVELKLNEPFAPLPFATLFYGGYIISKAAQTELGQDEYARKPVGLGPYEMAEWQPGSFIRLTKYTDYWEPGLPKIDEIVFRFIPDSTVRLESLRRNEVDFITHPDPKDVPQFRQGTVKSIQYAGVPGWEWDYMSFTLPPFIKEGFPTTNKLVRQAISYAINRQALVDQIYYGQALVTDSPIPPGFLSYRPVPIKYPKKGDLAKAKELMQQAGFASGFDLQIITSDKQWLRRETELTAAMLSEININAKPDELDIGTYNARWLGHKYQANLEDISIVSPDADSALYWFNHKNTVAWQGWNRPDVDKWLDEGRATQDKATRVKLYHDVVDAILEDCPYIYICDHNETYLFNSQLQGFVASPQSFILKLYPVSWT